MEEPKEREQKVEFDITDILYLIKKKFIGIIVFAILGGLLVGLYTYFKIAPTYSATAKLYIASSTGENIISIADLSLGENLAQDYSALLMTRPVMQSIIKELDLKMSYGALASMITISNPTKTRILQINVVSTDPELSAQIANEMANLSVRWLPEMMNSKEPKVIEEAIVPTGRVGPSYVKNAAIGAVVGAVIYFGICFVAFLLNDTIKSESDLERYFGITPLSVIPERNEDGKNGNSKHKKSSSGTSKEVSAEGAK